MLYRNVPLSAASPLSSWRKVALGTWRTAGDPSVYGLFKQDMRKSLAYIEKLKSESGEKVTVTHLVGRALAEAYTSYPQINVLRRWGRIYPRKQIDFFFHIAADTEGKDLSGAVIRNCNLKSVVDMARELRERSHKVRQQDDPDYRGSKKTSSLLPGFLTGALLKFLEYFLYVFNLWTPLLGLPRDPFGSAMVTNVGSIGTPWALVPLVPYSRVPLLVALGTIENEAVVDSEQKIVVAPVLKYSATFDHRIIDGVVASKMYQKVALILSDPEAYFNKVKGSS